ncbi:hypothetical protein [Streptomyces pilosus]|uniref:Uncharacterized protein n=1 Tax=Streptomyces pilosus TaxID=28893 RepID=A0A918BKG7_9ACTN|nr:hypothetical protein [Streptomyces pilosus]GGQ73983.1 hypothetical protein GCM10010280_20520 [Streptomyces pilosus]GGV61205.1 hypothetical protein GCM10010261_49900 [Streptomyces pilosus]
MSDIVTRPHTAESGTATPTPGLVIESMDTVAPQHVALFTICVMAANPAPAPAANGDLGA